MSGMSTFLSQKVIDNTLRGLAYTPPTTLYLALFTSDPTNNNLTANEATGAWYARVPTGAWAAATGTGNSTSNSNAITFAAVTGSSITISYYGIYDAATGGNLLYSGPLTATNVPGSTATPKTLNVGDIMVCNAGQLVLQVD